MQGTSIQLDHAKQENHDLYAALEQTKAVNQDLKNTIESIVTRLNLDHSQNTI